jgi:DNA-binding LacI/PurR family transcriptional regulator
LRIMATSLANVAQYAGVSEATVSRVVNGKPGVGASTRSAVLTALDVLGYQRPGQLRAERFRSVGILVPGLRNPIFPAFAEVVGTNLAQRGIVSVVCATGEVGMSEADCVEMLIDRRVSGLVFICGQHTSLNVDPAQYLRLVDRGLPLVAVNGIPHALKIPCVSTDDQAAVELAVGHLASLGHTRIGLITGENDSVNAVRKMAAFQSSMRMNFALDPSEPLIERSIYTIEGGFAAASRLLSRGVTAVVCGSDMMAVGAIRAARRAGLRVAQDFSVVGYDDSVFMPAVDPPLTTIRQPLDQMSRAIVTLLWMQMSGSVPQAEEILFQPDLVVRSSTAAPGSARRSTAQSSEETTGTVMTGVV